MKSFLYIALSSLIIITFAACSDGGDLPAQDESIGGEGFVDVSEVSKDESEAKFNPEESARKMINSLNYTNTGKMSDDDGPAFVAYSKRGYNGASVVIDIKNSEIQAKLPDGRHVNGYMFLGMDVYEGGYWANCFDAGLCWSGGSGGWHIFYNVYETVNESTKNWYESSKKLPQNGKYKLTLALIEDESALLTVEGLTNGFKDSVKIEVKGAKQDGSNISMLFNTALDYPQNTKVDENGDPSEDWAVITLANSDKGLYLRNIHATDMKLYKKGIEEDWTDQKNSAVSIWPDKAVEGFDYAPTEVFLFDGTEYYINLDMNRE